MDIELLKRIPLFASLSPEDLAGLTDLLEPRTLPHNKVIFFIGDRGDELFLVQHGTVRLSHVNDHGQDITLGTVGAGAFFGELSLLDGGPRTATAVTQSDVTLLALNRKNFFGFLEKHPHASAVMVTTMATRLRENLGKLRGIKNVNDAAEENVTRLQHMVDWAAAHFSSGKFLIFNLALFAIWITIQTYAAIHAGHHFSLIDDPPTYFFLGFMITTEAFLLTVFVLNSQKRQAERDRIRADFEYQINLKSEHEIMQLHDKVDKLTESLAHLTNKPAE